MLKLFRPAFKKTDNYCKKLEYFKNVYTKKNSFFHESFVKQEDDFFKCLVNYSYRKSSLKSITVHLVWKLENAHHFLGKNSVKLPQKFEGGGKKAKNSL